MKDLARAAAALALCCGVFATFAQSVAWDTTVVARVPLDDGPNAVALDAAGNAISAAGDCYAMKQSAADGSVSWAHEVAPDPGGWFQDCRVAIDASGDAVLAAVENGDLVAIKLAGGTGAEVWRRRSAAAIPTTTFAVDFTQLISVSLDASGNAVVAALLYGHQSTDQNTVRIARFLADGSLAWDRFDSGMRLPSLSYPESAYAGHAVAIDGSGDILIGGVAGVAKLHASDGSVAWHASIPAGFYGVAVNATGEVAATGCAPCDSSLHGDGVAVKLAGADGTVSWQRSFDIAARADVGFGAWFDANGDVVVEAGYDNTSTSDGFPVWPYAVPNVAVLKYRGADGTELWRRTSGMPGNDFGLRGTTQAPTGNIVITGVQRGLNNTADFRTLELSGADGATVWDAVYDGPAHLDDQQNGIAVDASGYVVVAGGSSDGNLFDYRMLRYAPSGALAWQTGGINRLFPRYTQPTRLKMDAAGNLFLAGYFRNLTRIPDDNEDFLTVRLSSVDGSIAWAAAYSTPQPEGPYDMDVDSAGNLAITGITTASNDTDDITTLKYAGANGALEWANRYDGPDHGNDRPIGGVASDPVGNVFVTGYSGGSGITFKYDSATGAVLWSMTHPPGATPDAIKVDTAGNPVLTIGTNDATWIAKFRNSDGQLLWQMPVTGLYYQRQLILDAAGNVFVVAPASGPALRILKIDGSSGAMLWDRSLSPWTTYTNFVSATLDASGNVIVGTTVPASTTQPGELGPRSSWYVAKISGTDGSVAWTRSEDFGGARTSSLNDVAVDGAGNVFAGGGSAPATTWYSNMEVVKYRPDGTREWVYESTPRTSQSTMSAYRLLAGPDALYIAASSSGDYTNNNSVTRIIKMNTRLAPAATSVMVTDSPAPSLNGQAAVFTATVGSGAGTPTGSVRFLSDGGAINGCASLALASGQAQCSTNSLAPGSHAITAQYLGNLDFAGSSGTVTHAVDSTAFTASTAQHLDFSGDGHSDLAWQSSDGTLSVWLMTGNTIMARAPVLGSAPGSVTKAADFDGDGKVDLVRQAADGMTTLYRMNGVDIVSSNIIRPPGSGWHLNNIGDFNGDGKADIVWRHDDGSVQVWLMDGATPLASATVMGANTGWTPAKVADFNGDGKSDLLWVYADGTTSLWLMDGTTKVSGGVIMAGGTGWRATHVGDFNGDGKSDLLWRHDGDGAVSIWLMDGLTQLDRGPLMPAFSGWSVAQVAKLNGDATTDILWQHTDGTTSAWLMNGRTPVAKGQVMPAGTGWSVAQVVDTRGAARGDLVWQNTNGSVGLWIMDWAAPVNAAYTATARYSVFSAGSAWRPAVGLEANR